MTILWEVSFNSLTVSIFIPILYISSLIHIFSTDYMAKDPYNQKKSSLISLYSLFLC